MWGQRDILLGQLPPLRERGIPHITYIRDSENAGKNSFSTEPRYLPLLMNNKLIFISMKKEHVNDITIHAAVITVSTTRTPESDTSGKVIQEILADAHIPTHITQLLPIALTQSGQKSALP